MDTITLKKDKNRIQTEQQIIHLLINIVEMYPQYTMSQHVCHILRKKGGAEESYHWQDEQLLKRFEDYYDELKQDLN
jgi:hypothetical protein